jgi:hypothetical protein
LNSLIFVSFPTDATDRVYLSTTPLPEKEYDEVSSWDCCGKRKMREQVPV